MAAVRDASVGAGFGVRPCGPPSLPVAALARAAAAAPPIGPSALTPPTTT